MTLGGKIRFLGFCIRDFIKFKKEDSVVYQWKEIEETLSDYNTGWKKVEKSLQNCLDYATENCEFYKPYKGKSLSEFPILTKMDFIENYDKIKNPLFESENLHTSSTSGSTGTPFKVVQNRGKRNRVLAELKYFGNIVGYKSHEKMAFYRSAHPLPFLSMFLTNVWQPDTSVLSNERLKELFKYQKDALTVFGYAHTLGDMVRIWKQNGLKGSKTVKAVITASEMLTKDTRVDCSEFWENAVVVSRYSNMENGILGQEIMGKENQFNINWASYYIEVLKFDSNEPAEYGELGRIVITDMHNKAFPLIRYDNGDVGYMLKTEGNFPIFGEIRGRRVDMIYDTSSNPVPTAAVSKRMWNIEGGIKQWQFIQEGETTYKILFNAENEEIALKCINERILKIKEILGSDADIVAQSVHEIPVLASGKRKAFVQKFKGGGKS